MSNKEQRKAPVLRFKGFTDDWEQRKLKELAIFNPKENLPEEFEYVDLESVIGTEMLSHKKTALNNAPSRAQRLAKKGDIFYQTVRPYQKNDYLFDKDAENYVFSTGYAQIRPKINGNFLFQLLRNERFVKKVLNECTGTSYPAINSKDLSNIKVSYTNYEKEQRSIGSFLDNLDNLVALQQRKLDYFQSIRKAILSRIFANKGKATLFFNDSNNTWKEIKLGNVATIIRGASPRPIADSRWFDEKSKVGWLRISDVTSQHGRIKHLEQHLSQLGEKKTRVLKTPHLLLSIAASVGYPVINYVPTGVHDGFLIFKNPQFQLNYGFYWLQSYRDRWQKYGQPGSQVNLNSSIVENTIIDLPSEAEQKEIVSLLSKVDHLIFVQKNKISSLKQVKKFLLQNLFI